MSKVKDLALASLLLALVIVVMYLATVIPVMSLTFVAIASIITYIAIIECKITYAILLFCAAVALGFLIVPDKSNVILYALLFGPYPYIKHFSERVRNKVLSWSIKLVCINALIVVLYFAFNALLLSFVPEKFAAIFAYIIFNVVFVTFDICITRLKAMYMWRVHHFIV